MNVSRAFWCQPAAVWHRPPRQPKRDEWIQWDSRAPGWRASPCGWWPAIIAAKRRLSSPGSTSTRLTCPGSGSSASTAVSGKASRSVRRPFGPERGAGSSGPRASASRGSALAADVLQGAPRALTQPSRRTGSAASAGRLYEPDFTARSNQVTVRSPNCRMPICMGGRVTHRLELVNCVLVTWPGRSRGCLTGRVLAMTDARLPGRHRHPCGPGPRPEGSWRAGLSGCCPRAGRPVPTGWSPGRAARIGCGDSVAVEQEGGA